MRSIKFIYLAGLLILTGCVTPFENSLSTEPLVQSEKPASTSRLTIYRSYKYLGINHVPDVTVNGGSRFSLKARGFRTFSLPAGSHKIEINSTELNECSFDLRLESNKSYFLRYEVGVDRAEWVERYEQDKEKALLEFSKEKFSSEINVVSEIHKTIPFDPKCFFINEALAQQELEDTTDLGQEPAQQPN